MDNTTDIINIGLVLNNEDETPELTEYTFQLVKMIPVVQVVTVTAEDSDAAFDMITPDDNAWSPLADYDYASGDWEVEDFSPRDEIEEDELVDENKPKRGRPFGSKNKPKDVTTPASTETKLFDNPYQMAQYGMEG